jgi:hypothetical protein
MFLSVISTHWTRLTWRPNSVLNHIASCLVSALVGNCTVELYCDLDELQTLGGGSILTDMVQMRRPDFVIHDRLVHGSHGTALVELTCPWDIDAKRAKERKIARYADLKTALSNEGWDCSLYLIKIGALGHIFMTVKVIILGWVPADHRSGIGQMMKDVRFLWCVCLPYFRLTMTLSGFIHILSHNLF